MRFSTSFVVFTSLALFAAGCGSAAPQATIGQPHAECLVCKHNADLACVDIPVDDKTPRCTRDGKTFFFCSDQCCSKFKKEPAKYEKD